MQYHFIINSTWTDNMYKNLGGNTKEDKVINWNQINSAIKVWMDSPSKFYIIGKGFIFIQNCFGHQSTSDLIRNKHGINIPCNRDTVSIDKGFVVVPQYRGKRLEEGATELPPHAKLIPIINIINGGIE